MSENEDEGGLRSEPLEDFETLNRQSRKVMRSIKKTLQSTGISCDFGRACDILPAELLEGSRAGAAGAAAGRAEPPPKREYRSTSPFNPFVDDEDGAEPGQSSGEAGGAGEHRQPVPAGLPQAKAGRMADVAVVDSDGRTLWTISVNDRGKIRRIDFEDGRAIMETAEPGIYALAQWEGGAGRGAIIDFVGAAEYDLRTGCVFYQNLAGTHAVALLPNGWILEQLAGAGGAESFRVSEPGAPFQERLVREPVDGVEIDLESGRVSFRITATGRHISF